MAHFGYQGHKLAYTIHGKGPRTTILMPGLLLSQKMQMPLAGDLASHGNRVVTFDFLGHGASDRPRDMWRYSIAEFARQAVALLDHLELDQAVVGGTSLGANITLETRRGRARATAGDGDRDAGARQRDPGLCGRVHAAAVRAHVRRAGDEAARQRRARIPRQAVPFTVELGLDAISQDPGPSGAVLQGILFGRTAPAADERARRSTRPRS